MLQGLNVDRLADRRSLLRSFDGLRRDIDASGSLRGMDHFTEQAFGLLTSSRLAEALDLSKEDPRIVARYGTGDPRIMIDANGAPRVPQSMLMARRLIEAGARVVTLNYSKWDWHGGTNAEGRADNHIFTREREDFPIFDQCVSALVEDLHVRGLSDDCTVIIMGEFGRTPRISAQVGRDHWPQVNCALLAGGGMKARARSSAATDRHRRWGRASLPRHLRRAVRHAISQPRHRREPHDDQRPQRPAAVSGGGSCAADARAGGVE